MEHKVDKIVRWVPTAKSYLCCYEMCKNSD